MRIRRAILREAGGKCANPGCANQLTELHHIREWHIYRSHDAEHMIAICPSCHDGVDRGKLIVNDETLYRWKQIRRAPSLPRSHIYVEPSELLPKLVLGTISVQSDTDFIVFDLSKQSNLEFCVRGEQIILPRLRIGSDTEPIIDVLDGHVLNRDPAVEFRSRAGQVVVTDSALASRLPVWALKILANDPNIDLTSQPLLELLVLRPGVLKVKGVWVSDDFVVVISEERLSFVHPGLVRPLSMIGDGGGTESVLKFTGPSILVSVRESASL